MTCTRLLSKQLKLFLPAIVSLIVTLGLSGCSSGGDGDGVRYLEYSGNIEPAVITLENAPVLVGNVLFGGISSTNIPKTVSTATLSSRSGGSLVIANQLLTAFRDSLDKILNKTADGYQLPVKAIEVDEKFSCESGYWTLKGTLADDGAGTLYFDYVNCLTNGISYDGSGSFRIDSIDITGNLVATMSFSLLNMVSDDSNVSASGSIKLLATVNANSETDKLTLHLVARDNLSSKMFNFENLVIETVIDDITVYPDTTGTQTISGRVYDSIHGYVDVKTNTPFSYSSLTQLLPDNGGVVKFSGALSASILLSVASGVHVKFELDLDGDSNYEVLRYLLWTELFAYTTTNLEDSDGDGMHDSWELTYGLNPTVDDASDDLDADTFSNYTEYEAGTNPNDDTSHP